MEDYEHPPASTHFWVTQAITDKATWQTSVRHFAFTKDELQEDVWNLISETMDTIKIDPHKYNPIERNQRMIPLESDTHMAFVTVDEAYTEDQMMALGLLGDPEPPTLLDPDVWGGVFSDLVKA